MTEKSLEGGSLPLESSRHDSALLFCPGGATVLKKSETDAFTQTCSSVQTRVIFPRFIKMTVPLT